MNGFDAIFVDTFAEGYEGELYSAIKVESG
jgi:hypothetical protein